MSEWLQAVFATIFGSNSWLATLIISMIPIVELRGAIPFGASTGFWGENALTVWGSFGISLAGSSLVCVILTFLFFPLFNWLKRTKCFKKLADFIEKKLKRNSKSIDDKAKNEKNAKRVLWLKLLGVFGFVAVPLPLTGVWTGTCLALFIGLSKKQTLAAVLSGNAVAGLLMTLISLIFKGNTSIVLYAFLILVAIFILIEVIKMIINKIKNKKAQTKNEKESVDNKETDSAVSAEGMAEKKQSSQIPVNEKTYSTKFEGDNKN